MNDLTDQAATQFILSTEAGDDNQPVEMRAFATVIGAKMWQECRRRAEERERKAFEAGWKEKLREFKQGHVLLPDDCRMAAGWRAYKERK